VFLDGGDDEVFIRIVKVCDEFFGVVGTVDASFLVVVELRSCLVIEVIAVDDKDHFMDFVEIEE